VSHIPKFGDASKSPVGDTASPARDVVASPNFDICDTADMKLEIIRCTIFPDGNQYLIESGRYRSKIDKKGPVIVFIPTFRCG